MLHDTEPLRLHILNPDEIKYVYETYMVQDFPADELKPYGTIMASLEAERYLCFGAFREDSIVGYAFFIPGDREEDGRRAALLDYLAVVSDERGTGVGSEILRKLPQVLKDFSELLIEIENPDVCTDPEEKLRRERRKRFYLRNGIHDSGVRTVLYGVNYQILVYSFDRTVIESGETEQRLEALYRRVLPDSWFHNGLFRVVRDGDLLRE